MRCSVKDISLHSELRRIQIGRYHIKLHMEVDSADHGILLCLGNDKDSNYRLTYSRAGAYSITWMEEYALSGMRKFSL